MHINNNNWQIGCNFEIQDKCQIKNLDLGTYKYDYSCHNSISAWFYAKTAMTAMFSFFFYENYINNRVIILFLGILLVSVLFLVIF